MVITHTTTLFIAVIAGERTVHVYIFLIKTIVNSSSNMFSNLFMISLVFDCSAKQNNTVTWFEAQTICRRMNQSITVHTNKSAGYYWTGLYERTSYWIKIIGILIKRYVH